MAGFVQKTVNKMAVRDLTIPIADVTSFDNLIETVIDDNPFGCGGYTGSDGQPVAGPVSRRLVQLTDRSYDSVRIDEHQRPRSEA
ncbi:hypothetical protein [Methanoculleus sp.]|uniref:hypothetical protein n=1 Tax=Methanoculleus sp. TaxID=90427 RepID=UPI0025CE5D59|nr:hypothetical protein [Methanoculleus sp.]